MSMLDFFRMCMQKNVRLDTLWPGLDLAAVKMYGVNTGVRISLTNDPTPI